MRRHALALPFVLLLSCAPAPAPESEAATPIPPFTVRGRWPDPLGLAVRIEPDGGPVPSGVFADTVRRALEVWETTGTVAFTTTSEGPADIVFRWQSGGDLFGRDTSVAATGPVAPPCLVQFDADRDWIEASGTGASLYQAAVHEAGHALGLGHSDDLESILHPQRENGRTTPAASDLAGLHSLYGGGSPLPGDLVIEREGIPALRGVAPAGRTEWTVFDSDGDGDDELLVWTTGTSQIGVLTVYHFAPGPRLERTVGPILGIGGYGASVGALANGDGRYLDAVWPDGTHARWQFDERGHPAVARTQPGTTSPRPPSAAELRARRSATGDLDGDGTLDPLAGS